MPLIALISDLHSNIEATQVVLEDIQKNKVDEVFCLGDVIGYGPNPRETIQLVKQFRVSLCGNHEEAVLFHAEDFNPKARRAIDWTREQLNGSQFDKEENYVMWDYLGDLQEKHYEGDVLYVHASPNIPTREYLLPKDAADEIKMRSNFEKVDRAAFCGHTHIPGVFIEGEPFKYARELNNEYLLQPNGRKQIINIGSVGQPRDGDNRVSYVLFDGEKVIWRRLPYDFKKTMAKILKIKDLAEYLALRLEQGK
ncbi:MAG: metallophosphoesterase family protein [Planctomycetota bacterium]